MGSWTADFATGCSSSNLTVLDFRSGGQPDLLSKCQNHKQAVDDALRRLQLADAAPVQACMGSFGNTTSSTSDCQTAVRLSSGHTMPLVGLGTWKAAPGAVAQAVRWALEAGYRHIDCAAVYQNEAEIGAALTQALKDQVVRRDDVFVTSKLWYAQTLIA